MIRPRSLPIVAPLVAVLLSPELAGAEPPQGGPRVSLQAGINTFELNQVESLYHGVVEYYRDAGLDIGTQRSFPANLLVGVETLWPLSPRVSGGFAAQFSWTRAFSGYADYAGTLDVDASVRMLSGSWVLRRTLPPMGAFVPYLGGSAGLTWARVRFEQTARFVDFPEADASDSATWNALGPIGEVFLGAECPLGRWTLTGRVGGRYALATDSNLRVNLSGLVISGGLLWAP